MLTKGKVFILFLLILIPAGMAFSFQNPSFKEEGVIFHYADRPRHYSERADSVKIHIINESLNFEKTLDLTRISPGIWRIVIPMNYLYREAGITKYTYFYYFIVDGRKILDPTNSNRTMDYERGVEGKVSFFKMEHRQRQPHMVTRNPEIMTTGMIFYFTREVTEGTIVKLMISKEGTDFSRVFTFRTNREGMKYVFVKKDILPEKKMPGRYLYKFIINGKYVLDTLNPNQTTSPIGGTFNLVVIEEPGAEGVQIPVSPVVKMEGLIFYCKAPRARRVALITDLNGWREQLPMHKSGNPRYKGVWTILLSVKNRELPLTAGKFRYKYVIDGVITHDMDNPNFEEDGLGSKVSVFTLEKPLNYYGTNPIHLRENIYRFFIMTRRAQRVFLVGNFNDWNPFTHRMTRVNDDLFIIDVILHPGTYYYNFVLDNQWTHDPRNTEVAYNQVGQRVSVVVIKKITRPMP